MLGRPTFDVFIQWQASHQHQLNSQTLGVDSGGPFIFTFQNQFQIITYLIYFILLFILFY